MRFIVDECTGSRVSQWLKEQGHEVFSVFDEARGATDEFIIKKAFKENKIIIEIIFNIKKIQLHFF